MARNSVSRRVAQKEMRLFFASPVAWLFLATFAAVTLFIFFWVESFFARNIADIRPLFEWMPVLLIFLSGALTMRMWSEERRTGTLEHVLTQPVGLWRFVMGKFRACLGLLLLALLSTLALPISVTLIGNLDWGPVVAGYLASVLLGAAYLSIGLFVSARTDNPIVALMGSVALCGVLYLLGSTAITDFFDNRVGETLRLLGSGARFDSITSGVIDVRDLAYYLSLTAGFLALNVYTLEQERWARTATTARHRRWRAATVLLLLNLVAANTWLYRLDHLRLDVTEGRLYSLSQPSRDYLAQLQEPLLLRAYFSAKTHPLLAPLVPRLRDVLREYEIAGDGRVRVEWVDPARNPTLEREANERFGIRATPFQVADRYQSALVNSYFNILVQYADEYRSLGFTDLIEARASPKGPPEVRLRNPEFELTRAIREVLYQYRSGGNLFDSIDHPIEFIAYVSGPGKLPPMLRDYRNAMVAQLDRWRDLSGGKFSFRFIDPEAQGGQVASQIAEQWGFVPMLTPLGEEQSFYFYLTLADDRQVVQLPTDQFDPERFDATLEAGLKRFAAGFTRTVALSLPEVHPEMARFNLGGPTFTLLEQAITRDFSIRMLEPDADSVPPEADILVLLAPHRISERALFAIDQYLMRGGTVLIASSPYSAEVAGGELRLQDWPSGLEDWLEHHGLHIGDSLVLDERNTAFPAPIARQAGGFEFRDVQMVDYPYFIDIRDEGLAETHPVTASLPQLTMTWASPITVESKAGRRVTPLLRSSSRSWLSDDMDILPRVNDDGRSSLRPSGERRSQLLGLSVQGRFDSWFAEREIPARRESMPAPTGAAVDGLLSRSPESARIVLYASNDFLDDQILSAVSGAGGIRSLGAPALFLNTLDWALQDEQLTRIRSRGHFNRTLPPMDRSAQVAIEYLNYGLAVAWLALMAAVYALRKMLRRRHYARGLAL